MKEQEIKIIQGLQPIRHMALAQSLFNLFSSGLYDYLNENKVSVSQCATDLQFDKTRLTAFLKYLRNEGIVSMDDVVSLTEYAKSFELTRPWYEMMVGGYSETFLSMGEGLKAEAEPLSRNATWVGIGSCGISQFDSIPIVRNIIERAELSPKTICDLGCGSAVYLTELCNDLPQANAIGIEPDLGGSLAAINHVSECGLSDRIDIVQADAISYIESMNEKPDLLLLCFVIHEVLGQSGEDAAIEMLKRAMAGNADQRLIIIDIDYLIDDKKSMQHGLGLAHYNPYLLLHPFTSQRLEKQQYWDSLFAKAGLEVIDKQYTLPEMDSTNICMGWLLKRKN
ncbi:2-ketoarginine methyltransferase [Vibrio sp. 070316B]|uniref:2-ketoarginine methyltransferase n=1 Tax=Vibrio TaxID=662 RepID=UPI001493A35A|nr:2-ketoarginine methyltransferase [Vibrio sp. 070316B]NOI39432.1 2-ketoarginine methyltransferase [Vibrio sp. 070316B]